MSEDLTKLPRRDGSSAESAAPTDELLIGSLLWDRYEIAALLGTSDLGKLWRCRDLDERREVTLRRLPPDLRRSKPALAAIHAGIQRMANQAHPNVAAIRQLTYVGDQIFLLGDYAPGVDLGTWRSQGENGRRTLAEALPVLEQAAAALDFAHGHGLVHRNIKTTNVFVDAKGVVRVADFGLAPHRHMTLCHGEAVRTGTTGIFLAPELRGGEGVPDAASDQYALAVLAWNLLGGGAEGPADGGAWPEGLSGAARNALKTAFSVQPRKRFASCGDFVRALGGGRVAGRRGRSKAEWRRLGVATAIGLAVLLVAGGLWVGARSLTAWLDGDSAATSGRLADDAGPPPTVEETTWRPPPPLAATTPIPVAGQPWVAHSVPMEFMWVPSMRMWVGRYEVTNEEYARMDPDHDSGSIDGHPLNGPRQPVVRVNYDDTVAYAAWLTEREREAGKLPEELRYRLPSRLEAVTYTRAGFAGAYPWGEMWPPNRGNYADSALASAFPDKPAIADYQDGFAATAPVERSGENAWGLFGAGGNVWETTTREPGGEQFGGWQGGGWEDHLPARMRSDAFYGFIGNARGAVNGFRLVLAPIAGETRSATP